MVDSENKLFDPKALFNIGYGLYVVTTSDGKKDNGLIVNAVMQVTSDPNRVAVIVNKANYSCEAINVTRKLNINVIDESASFDLFKKFGFVSGRDKNKFENEEISRSSNGLAIIANNVNSYISLEVYQVVDLGTHLMFICDVKESKVLSNISTMTYTYYQTKVKPKPETAKKGWVCKICGYVYEGDELPKDFVCPICKHGPSDFEKNTTTTVGRNIVMKFRCKICGQIVEVKEGEPCPICGAKFENLEVVEEAPQAGNLTWACKHDIGVAKDVDAFVLQGCRDHFKGECSEVGMYKAMARQALREGYPEIAMLFDRIAEEEAEHAAKFAELLGEVVVDDTKANIEKMLAGENGACASKLEIAKKAKELNYDAIHDAVHEMAKDEQRHGAALEAMLKRYF